MLTPVVVLLHVCKAPLERGLTATSLSEGFAFNQIKEAHQRLLFASSVSQM
jgi:hypothetical protein